MHCTMRMIMNELLIPPVDIIFIYNYFREPIIAILQHLWINSFTGLK